MSPMVSRSAGGGGRAKPSKWHSAISSEIGPTSPVLSLHLALERMGSARLDVLPVVSRANVHTLLGIIALRDVLDAYGVAGQHEEPPRPPKDSDQDA